MSSFGIWRCLGFALLLMVSFVVYVLLVVSACRGIAWLIHRYWPYRKPLAPYDPRGSSYIVDSRHPGRHPIALTIAILAGMAGTAGLLLYWIGSFANPILMPLGMVLLGVSAAITGIIFGTSDRDFYL